MFAGHGWFLWSMVQSDSGSGPLSVRKIEQPAPLSRGGIHCTVTVVSMWFVRSFVSALPGPLDRCGFPFGSWWMLTVRFVFASFQVAGSRFQGRSSTCVSRLAYRVSSVNWGRLGPAHMSLQLAALPPGKMRLTQGSTFRFFFQGLLSLGHLGALLQIRLPGYHLRIRDFKELRGQRTGQGQDPRSRLPGSAGCHSLTTIMESPFGHRQG